MRASRLLVVLLLATGADAKPHPKGSAFEITYAETNRAYFRNRLPKHPRFIVQELGRKRGFEIVAETIVEKRKVTIYLSPRFGEHNLAQMMIHEQCHVATWDEPDEHGARWKACMESRGLTASEVGE
jgi:SprT-like family